MFTVKQVRECDSHNGQKVHESWSIRFCQIERFEHFDMNCSRVGDSIVLRQVEVSNLFFQQSNLSTSIQMISNGEKPEGRIFLDCGSSRSSDIQDRFCSREEVQGGNDSCLIKAFLQARFWSVLSWETIFQIQTYWQLLLTCGRNKVFVPLVIKDPKLFSLEPRFDAIRPFNRCSKSLFRLTVNDSAEVDNYTVLFHWRFFLLGRSRMHICKSFQHFEGENNCDFFGFRLWVTRC